MPFVSDANVHVVWTQEIHIPAAREYGPPQERALERHRTIRRRIEVSAGANG